MGDYCERWHGGPTRECRTRFEERSNAAGCDESRFSALYGTDPAPPARPRLKEEGLCFAVWLQNGHYYRKMAHGYPLGGGAQRAARTRYCGRGRGYMAIADSLPEHQLFSEIMRKSVPAADIQAGKPSYIESYRTMATRYWVPVSAGNRAIGSYGKTKSDVSETKGPDAIPHRLYNERWYKNGLYGTMFPCVDTRFYFSGPRLFRYIDGPSDRRWAALFNGTASSGCLEFCNTTVHKDASCGLSCRKCADTCKTKCSTEPEACLNCTRSEPYYGSICSAVCGGPVGSLDLGEASSFMAWRYATSYDKTAIEGQIEHDSTHTTPSARHSAIVADTCVKYSPEKVGEAKTSTSISVECCEEKAQKAEPQSWNWESTSMTAHGGFIGTIEPSKQQLRRRELNAAVLVEFDPAMQESPGSAASWNACGNGAICDCVWTTDTPFFPTTPGGFVLIDCEGLYLIDAPHLPTSTDGWDSTTIDFPSVTLELNGNNLAQLPDLYMNGAGPQEWISEVDLRNNQLTILPTLQHRVLSLLKLEGNYITEVDGAVLAGLTALVELRLGRQHDDAIPRLLNFSSELLCKVDPPSRCTSTASPTLTLASGERTTTPKNVGTSSVARPDSNEAEPAAQSTGTSAEITAALVSTLLLVVALSACGVGALIYRRNHRRAAASRAALREYTMRARCRAWARFVKNYPGLLHSQWRAGGASEDGVCDPFEPRHSTSGWSVAIAQERVSLGSEIPRGRYGRKYRARLSTRPEQFDGGPAPGALAVPNRSFVADSGLPAVAEIFKLGKGGGMGSDRSVAKDSSTLNDFLVEAHVQAAIRCDNIVRVIGIVADALPMMLITEHLIGGDLKTYVRSCRPTSPKARERLGAAELVTITLQVANACEYLELRGIVHRALMAQNVLVGRDHRTVKLAGFALAREANLDSGYYRPSEIGPDRRDTIRWYPPELFGDGAKYTAKTDVWSLGVMVWEIFTYGKLPFGKLALPEIKREARGGGAMLEQPPACPDDLYCWLQRCWNAELPSARPKASSLCGLAKLLAIPATDKLRQSSLAVWELKQPNDRRPPTIDGSTRWNVNKTLGHFGIATIHSHRCCHTESASSHMLQDRMAGTVAPNADAAIGIKFKATPGLGSATLLSHFIDELWYMRHPNIAVDMLGCGGPSDPVLFMRWPGQSLFQALGSGRLRPGADADKAATIALEVAQALEYLTCKGRPHGHVSSHMVYLGSDLRAKVLVLPVPNAGDRNQARFKPNVGNGAGYIHIGATAGNVSAVEAGPPPSPPQTNEPFPTDFRWWPPERMLLDRATAAADSYSFGVVLWELFHNEVPFAAVPLAETLQALVASTGTLPALPCRWPVLWAAMEELFAQCCALEPGARPDAFKIVLVLLELVRGPDRWEVSGDDFQLLEQLGEGQYGTVDKMLTTLFEPEGEFKIVAVKTLKDVDDQNANTEFMAEINVMKKFRHPNLVRLLGACTATAPPKMILECVSGGSLEEWLPVNGKQVGSIGLGVIAHQSAQGLAALHQAGIVHRDLAARNVSCTRLPISVILDRHCRKSCSF